MFRMTIKDTPYSTWQCVLYTYISILK